MPYYSKASIGRFYRRAIHSSLLLTAGVLLPLTYAAAQQPDYVIGTRDVLSVLVWDQPNLSGKFTVEGDGTFTFPLAGRVTASGRGVHEVEDELKRLLGAGYLVNPQLSLSVEQYRSQMVYVTGEVRQPGGYPLTGTMTLIEVLARAGSTTERAGRTAIVTRPQNKGVSPVSSTHEADMREIFRINLAQLQSGVLTENIQVRDGDTVFVPRSDNIYVFGQVRNPGMYPIDDQTTVVQALALAGGLTERGSTKRIHVLRRVDGRDKRVNVKPAELLRAGDTLIVGERFF